MNADFRQFGKMSDKKEETIAERMSAQKAGSKAFFWHATNDCFSRELTQD
jgi:hypothetical protein